ncbi:MAG: peroxide stress protein YaaA [Lentimicrobiaceae bacterium]|jgi:hypothetical protein|nr:peroxide stress protein YaaA [Lentimicrobiaceae bacterium]MBT3455040.1 peroxide stress protein YaaA [Lentimicrobiaceae bacterium]MBT3818978.1 peroxide stress protein YaaA [Lentimicrobiaceae bacterium]MBT4062003.1 peroxide stress protein YaaA [Lentimicrobiaceae bacterium]MBT4189954.1 peroxide stress protein YaaA [Lentimicrobiaceae bacterium]
MIIILSPSKTINQNLSIEYKNCSLPVFLSQSQELVKNLKTLTVPELGKLMNVSSKLAELTYDRYQFWSFNHTYKNSWPAIQSFRGDVYTGLDAVNFTDDDLAYANKHLLIFSGLYGVLKPMDLIQPYRLEIATKFSIDNHKDLYSYWIDIITAELNEIFSNENNPVMINLASNEYFKSFSKKDLNAKIITPVFKEYKQGNYKIVSIYAKRARGLLSAYLIKNKIDQIDDIKSFDEEGYIYNNSLSGTNEIVFTRR